MIRHDDFPIFLILSVFVTADFPLRSCNRPTLLLLCLHSKGNLDGPPGIHFQLTEILTSWTKTRHLISKIMQNQMLPNLTMNQLPLSFEHDNLGPKFHEFT
jgi:hypothetical protein